MSLLIHQSGISIDATFYDREGITWAIDALTKAREAFFLPKSQTFDCFLVGVGDQKINAIKEVRSLTGLGLKEAKDAVESLYYDGKDLKVISGTTRSIADRIKDEFRAFGAEIDIREAE